MQTDSTPMIRDRAAIGEERKMMVGCIVAKHAPAMPTAIWATLAIPTMGADGERCGGDAEAGDAADIDAAISRRPHPGGDQDRASPARLVRRGLISRPIGKALRCSSLSPMAGTSEAVGQAKMLKTSVIASVPTIALSLRISRTPSAIRANK